MLKFRLIARIFQDYFFQQPRFESEKNKSKIRKKTKVKYGKKPKQNVDKKQSGMYNNSEMEAENDKRCIL